MGRQTMRQVLDSYRVVASFSAIFGLRPISCDAFSPTSPLEPPHTETKGTIERGVYNSFENSHTDRTSTTDDIDSSGRHIRS